MKYIAIVALMINFGGARVYAQGPVTMTFSGTGASSAINLSWPNTSNVEENVAGSGTFGQFTFRDVRAASNSPQASTTCAAVFFPTKAGGGIFRFQDGGLLYVNITGGGDCINFVTGAAHCTLTFQITGGTGRFQHASGVLTYNETPAIVSVDFTGNPVFFAETGGITGLVSGVAAGQGQGPQ